MSDVLARICADKKEHITKQKSLTPLSMLESKIHDSGDAPRGFLQALSNKQSEGMVGLIAEIKKASPSKGLIREDFNPQELALAYQSGGAACLSILTDIPYFQGNDFYLGEARNSVSLPCLRKDFMLDIYQVVESRALGADCILLIMAALSDNQAVELEQAALSLGMDVLVEVHDTKELERALKLKTKLVGVNNRNLKTLEIDLVNSEQMLPMVPSGQGYVTVCESGIYHHNDIVRMQNVGINNFLVGESLMRQNNVTDATIELLGTSK